jgi:hypothetical protein
VRRVIIVCILSTPSRNDTLYVSIRRIVTGTARPAPGLTYL